MKKNTLGQEQNFENTHFPKTRDEVLELVLQFKKKRETYFAVSTGNNWGYGCDNSYKKTTHCINLKHMNRIIEFDSNNGIITIEPGVTYGQLSIYLEENDASWITPVHGGGPNCSVVGNTIERGYGITPITDHFSACQSLEAILPTGETYENPFKSLGLKKLGRFFRNGIGPYLDGIFTQSNLGIVTQMTIKLAPKSKSLEIFVIDLNDSELALGVHAIKQIKKTLGSSISGMNLMNKERLLSMLIQYPEKDILDRKPLDQNFIDLNVKKKMISPWTIVGSIHGDHIQVKALKKIIKREIKILKGKKVFVSQKKLNLLKTVANYVPNFFGFDLKTTSDTISQLMNILNGIPQNTALKLAYWKNLNSPPSDNLNPKRDNCGLIWYAPLVEMDSSNVLDYVNFIKDVSKRFEMTPLITLTTIDELCFDSTIPILFNQQDLEDHKRAHEYFNALLTEGKEKGFYPYRLGTNSMEHYFNNLDDSYSSFLQKLKRSIDPEELFAPNRYTPSSTSSINKKHLTCL